MFKFSQLNQIHLEITNNCQAKCPMCIRNIHGGVENPLINLTDWSLDDYTKVISKEVINQIRMINFCGNYGDPLLNNNLLEMISYTVRITPTIQVIIHTNGSLRTISWWKELARTLPKNHNLVFAIDGLEDTNHIYRIGTNYKKIIENAKAFIDAGGVAEWAFIRFKHNQHQVDDARQIAKTLGFKQFVMKDSSRFLIDKEFPVYDKDRNIKYYIEPSTDSNIKIIDKSIIDNYKIILDKTKIDCYALHLKEIYVTAQGNVFPCCWLGLIPYNSSNERSELALIKEEILNQYSHLVDSLGSLVALSGFNNSLKSIIESDAYQTVWHDYWNKNKLITCARTCGSIPEIFSSPNDQYTSREVINESN